MEEKLWYKSYAPGIPKLIEYDRLTIPRALQRTAERFPSKTALNYMGKKITFRQLDGLVNGFARGLENLGICKGDKVAVILPNIPQVIIANMAIFRLGAVAVLNNPLYTERELAYQLDDSDARLAISLSLLAPRLESILPETKVENLVLCQLNDYLPLAKRILFPLVKKEMYRKFEQGRNVFRFKDLIATHETGPIEDRSEWLELSTLIYTGGTTGVSKGVMLSHANISCNMQQLRAWVPAFEDGKESVLGNFPIFHSAGFTVCENLPLKCGWEHVMIPRPEPDTIVELLKKYRPRLIPGVPTIYIGLLNHTEFRNMDLSFIEGFFSGAAPLAPETIRELKEATGADLLEFYGLTETSPVVCGNPVGGASKPGTVGVPIPDTDVRIVDLETGSSELPTGETGEIIIRGPQVMMGYYKKPQETREALRGGWLYTGDIGFIDGDGYVTIVDRKKDMIIASGFNIYPIEIDNVLLEHPKILEACAVGVPDSYRGETVKVFIVKKDESLTGEEVKAFAREKLAAYKVPKSVEFVEELPKSAVGKVLRKELRDREMAKNS